MLKSKSLSILFSTQVSHKILPMSDTWMVVWPRMLIRTGSLGELLRKKASKPNTRIGSPEDFHLVRHWLGHCLSFHSKCLGSDPKHSPLPTRVLDVNLDECGSSIKLVSGKGRDDRYITL